MKSAIGAVLAVLALGLGWAPAQAQNLLTNPDFDADLSGWTVDSGSWSFLAAGWPTGVFTPGSAQGQHPGTVAGSFVFLTQCVQVSPSTPYLASFYGFIPTGQGSTGEVFMRVNRYSTTGCTSLTSQGDSPTLTTPGTSWQHSSATFSTSASEHSVRVSLAIRKPAADGPFEARLDGVYLGRPVKGDLNADGRVDLLLDDLASSNHQVWFMAKERQATATALSPAADGPDWKLSAIDDFDGGSSAAAFFRDDLVFRNTVTGELQFWLMNGATRASVAALSGAQPPAVEWQLTAAADFNQDGQADLLWRNAATQKLMVWTMNGTAFTGALVPSPDQAADANWACVAALDVDKDGHPDLLWYNATTGKIVIWYMDASLVRLTGKFAEPPNAGNNNWKVLAAGDYARVAAPNLDSVDLVWRNETSGKLVLWYLDSSFVRVGGGFTTPDSPSPALGWTVAGPR